MNRAVRWVASLVVGCLVAIAVARGAFAALRSTWPDYAAAEPTKAYTLAMMFSRLGIGALCTAGAACAATLVAADDGRIGWWVGALFLALSAPVHLHTVWNDYPAWYHFVYLGYLIPIAGLSARALRASLAPRGGA